MNFFNTGFNHDGRVVNVIRNMKVSFLCKIISLILSFISRSIFISMLGKTYLGVNGIFSNILMLLSLTELGLGTAVVYSLYKPLKEHDEQTIVSLLSFYQKVYYAIGLIILTVGLFLLPFLKLLIKEQPDIRENIIHLYLLHLIGTVCTYFYAHKLSLLKADQKSYIGDLFAELFRVIQIILQVIILLLTANYFLYLTIQLSCNFLMMLCLASQVDKIYPFLHQIHPKKLSKNFLETIQKDIKSLFLYRINRVIIHGTDNILIASLVANGVQIVGLYSNYVMIAETANMILSVITNTFTHSIGNLNTEDDIEKKERIFYCVLLICAWLYGFTCAGILCFAGNFIELWVGSEYVLGISVVAAEVLQVYIRSVHFAAYTYRITSGLFVQAKYIPLLTSAMNIVLSIWWGKIWGLFGIIFATSIARIFTIGISDPYFVYKYVFNKNVIHYYIRYFYYLSVTVCAAYVGYLCTHFVTLSGLSGFVLTVLIFSIIFNFIYIILVAWTSEFSYICGYFKIVLFHRSC